MSFIHKKSVVFDYVQIIFGSALVALAFNIFLLPSRIAAGGISGVSTILYELFGYNPAIVQWLINIPLIVLGLIIAGKEFSAKTIVGTFCVPLVIYLTAGLEVPIDNPLLSSIYGGIVLGIGLGIVYRGNGSTGGTALIAQLLKKYTGISSGFSQLIVDGVVVVTSAFVFNFELALYALMSIYVTSKVIDFVQLQTSPTKLVLIITENEEKIQSIIKNEIDRGLTKVKSTGGFSNDEKTMIFCVVEQSEAVYLKKVLQAAEPSSFVIFLNASEILGLGFSKSKIHQ
ncbi:YitT family protein [Sporosarcina thermotolerans]|uniref:YitT family protein n=1 Tax=Sporosarcina thermotolerans TaxID=633404 RepID=A0AAW9A8V8_9BACL|nr:YitT family protein [Sporosarcina thermotolerans]MDW0117068.1 YitT family protein [Sporosarcina thermotolerans]WHT47830.1 YitT family protein [Sporosarcina thermotolerans]